MSASQLSELLDHHGRSVVYMISGGFEYFVRSQGGVFLGMSLRGCEADALLVIRASFDGRRMVAFAGGADGVSAIAAAHRELRKGSLKWRPDRFATSHE